MGIWIDTEDYYGRRPGMKHLAEAVAQAERDRAENSRRGSSSDVDGKTKTGEDADSKQERERQRDERIEQTGQLTLERHGEEERAIHMISIIGEIEGHDNLSSSSKTTKYEHILPQLAAIEDSSRIEGLLILLNTMGGDVEAGLAIAEMIASLSKPTVSLVLGGGHSIGVPIAVSADYSFIVPSGTMVIHPVRMSGTVIGAPQTFDYFKQIQAGHRIRLFSLRSVQKQDGGDDDGNRNAHQGSGYHPCGQTGGGSRTDRRGGRH